jgi:hypothetical protein
MPATFRNADWAIGRVVDGEIASPFWGLSSMIAMVVVAFVLFQLLCRYA